MANAQSLYHFANRASVLSGFERRYSPGWDFLCCYDALFKMFTHLVA